MSATNYPLVEAARKSSSGLVLDVGALQLFLLTLSASERYELVRSVPDATALQAEICCILRTPVGRAQLSVRAVRQWFQSAGVSRSVGWWQKYLAGT